MAANVETMFSVREKPWHGLGTIVQDAPNSAEAIRLAGLDWAVIPKPLFIDGNPEPIEGLVANTRSSDNSVLGVVTPKYKAVQNVEAFDFVDALIDNGDVRYETAGALQNGKKVWMLGKLNQSSKILGDEVEQYVVFSNSHDGKGAIQIAVTPIRVVCQNTLNLALNNASRMWSTRHMGNMQEKLIQAQNVLNRTKVYMEALSETAEGLSQYSLRRGEIEMILDAMFPIEEDATDRVRNNKDQCKEEILTLCSAPDLQKFGSNNAWTFVNAVADWVDHRIPQRASVKFAESNFDKIVSGHPVLDQAYSLVKTLAKVA